MHATTALSEIVAGRDARCSVVIAPRQPFVRLRALQSALAQARPGEYVAFGVALDLPLAPRLGVMAMLRWHRRRIERAIASGGGRALGWYGVDPNFDAFACVFELDTPAACYADQHLRPRGSRPRIKQLMSRWFGCDPSLGGLMVVSRKLPW
jgi:hypothetical protein